MNLNKISRDIDQRCLGKTFHEARRLLNTLGFTSHIDQRQPFIAGRLLLRMEKRGDDGSMVVVGWRMG